ncbi:MAG TPA: sigma-70 family RNA polymerase sigma factor [Rhizomicrobium sp.]|nr:sigma-70 family RNA polymerase sigma factor [Rhizomicrobium sp.]
MLAHAQTDAFVPLPARARSSGVVLQLLRAPAMNRPAETAEMDALLGRVARDRDRAAFAALFIHFAPRVKAYLLRLGAPAGVAEELAQEALLSVWRKAHLFDPAKASAATWLFTIARNLRIDAIRRERRPELDPQDFMPEAEACADAGLMLAENEGRLRIALKQLPADQIQVVELSFFADKPHSQIAAELGIPLGTVKSRLRLAMGRLKRAMGGEV